MNTGVFASKYVSGINNLRCETAAVHIATSSKRKNAYCSHLSFSRRKFWAWKVIYRGSAANFLSLQRFCANPGIPPQKPPKVCPLRRVLQQAFGRPAEQNRGLGGDIRLKSGPYLLLFLLLHGGRPGSGRPNTTLENILPQERYQLVAEKSLQCLPCATQMHTRRWGSLPAPSWPGDHGSQRCLKGCDRASKLYSEKRRETILGSETISS